MHPSLRPLLLATGALLLTAASASAQFIELVTEAPVTFQISLTTVATTETPTQRKTTSTIARLTQAQIIEELRTSVPGMSTPATGWSLLAVSAAPADLAYVDGSFHLYAVNGTNPPILIPASKFSSAAYFSVRKYTEKHLGQYVLSSKGTVTSHVSYEYEPKFSIGSTTFSLSETATDGFATISYQSKDLSDNHEVFFYAVNSIRATARGSFTGTTQVATGPVTPTAGLISITVTVGAAKLVPATRYPGLDYFTSELTTAD